LDAHLFLLQYPISIFDGPFFVFESHAFPLSPSLEPGFTIFFFTLQALGNLLLPTTADKQT
jgi:hypothetical protein